MLKNRKALVYSIGTLSVVVLTLKLLSEPSPNPVWTLNAKTPWDEAVQMKPGAINTPNTCVDSANLGACLSAVCSLQASSFTKEIYAPTDNSLPTINQLRARLFPDAQDLAMFACIRNFQRAYPAIPATTYDTTFWKHFPTLRLVVAGVDNKSGLGNQIWNAVSAARWAFYTNRKVIIENPLVLSTFTPPPRITFTSLWNLAGLSRDNSSVVVSVGASSTPIDYATLYSEYPFIQYTSGWLLPFNSTFDKEMRLFGLDDTAILGPAFTHKTVTEKMAKMAIDWRIMHTLFGDLSDRTKNLGRALLKDSGLIPNDYNIPGLNGEEDVSLLPYMALQVRTYAAALENCTESGLYCKTEFSPAQYEDFFSCAKGKWSKSQHFSSLDEEAQNYSGVTNNRPLLTRVYFASDESRLNAFAREKFENADGVPRVITHPDPKVYHSGMVQDSLSDIAMNRTLSEWYILARAAYMVTNDMSTFADTAHAWGYWGRMEKCRSKNTGKGPS